MQILCHESAEEANLRLERDPEPLLHPRSREVQEAEDVPGDYAGRLIDSVGLKGYRVGHATWSNVHANFISNLGGATARDVLALMTLARSRVKERFGIALEAEVRLVGELVAEDLELLRGS